MYGKYSYFTNPLKLGIFHASTNSEYQASLQGEGTWGQDMLHAMMMQNLIEELIIVICTVMI